MPARRHRRVHRGAEFWQAALRRQVESGKSAAAFCRGEGLSAATFSHWQRKLGAATASSAMLPVAVVTGEQLEFGAAAFEVMLRSGHIIRVPGDFNGESLARLVSVLESLRC